uniref:Uncharacterized protein n=1 Tax=Heterorhabditis bacteriophora TaxID=37862 RepID=A0A1I7XEK1_HETBA
MGGPRKEDVNPVNGQAKVCEHTMA